MSGWISALLALGGAVFVLIAALGVVRLPDVLSRLHAATKAGAFGAALLLGALLVQAPAASTAIKASLVLVAFYVTAPLAGHLVGRTAYRSERSRLKLTCDDWRKAEATDPAEPSTPN